MRILGEIVLMLLAAWLIPIGCVAVYRLVRMAFGPTNGRARW